MKLPFKLYSKKKYWVWKKRIQLFQFLIRKLSFGFKKSIDNEQQKIYSFWYFARTITWSCVKSIGFISILFSIEYFANQWWALNSSGIPSWLQNIQEIIPKPSYPNNENSIIELISVIAGVAGVILALIYPVIATIISTAYTEVSVRIRTVILKEKQTKNVLTRLASLTTNAVVVLSFMSFNYLPGNLVLSYLTIYSIATVFFLFRYWVSVFNFFEPSNLSNTVIVPNLMENIKAVTIGGEYHADISFQTYHHNEAIKELQDLSIISKLCVKNIDSNDESFSRLMQSILDVLVVYLMYKNKILIESNWFSKIRSHLSYFESDLTSRPLSISTYTFINPKSERNLNWFEEELMGIMITSINEVVSKGYVNKIGNIILKFLPVINLLSIKTDIPVTKTILDSFLSAIEIHLSEKKKENINYIDCKDELIIVESLCILVMHFQQNYFNRLIEFNTNKFNKEYDKIKWHKKDTIYKTDFIPEIYKHLERFQMNIENEIYIENKKITPDWYIKQAIVAEYLGAVSDNIMKCVQLFDEYILKAARISDENKNYILSSHIMLLGLEGLYKFENVLKKLDNILLDINSLETCKGEMTWTSPDLESINKIIAFYHIQCVNKLSINLDKLSLISWNSKFPDLFGHSYKIIDLELTDALGTDDVERYKRLLANFIKASINASIQLRETFKHYMEPIRITNQPIIEALQISGYSYIYSVLYNKPEYWELTKTVWDGIFSMSSKNIEIIVNHYNYFKGSISISGNSTEIQNREKVYFDAIDRLAISETDISDPWVKIFYPDMDRFSLYYDPAELFIELYFFSFVEAKETAANMSRRKVFERFLRIIK